MKSDGNGSAPKTTFGVTPKSLGTPMGYGENSEAMTLSAMATHSGDAEYSQVTEIEN